MTRDPRFTYPPETLAEEWRDRGLWRDELCVDRFEAAVDANPDKTAIIHRPLSDEPVRLSYRELAAQVDQYAAFLAAMGVDDRATVAVQLPDWYQLLVVHLACSRINGRFMPIHRKWGTREVTHLLDRAEATVWFVPGRETDDVASLVETATVEVESLDTVVTVDGAFDDGIELDDVNVYAESAVLDRQWTEGDVSVRSPSTTDGAFVMVSSGTTSLPTPSLWSENNLLCLLLEHYADCADLSEADVTASLAPAGTGATGYVYPVLAQVLVGATGVIMERWSSPADAIQLLNEYDCTGAMAVPTQMTQMSNAATFEDYDYEAFRCFSNGGSPLPVDTAESIESVMGCRVQVMYGTTEAGIPIMGRVDDPPDKRRGTIGRPQPGEEVRLETPDGGTADPGEEGEIVWRGPDNTLGLLNSPTEEAEAWDAEGWFYSGDIGRVDEEGYVEIVGRKKEMILRGGHNINPTEIENYLVEHPAVSEVAVAPMPDPELQERACAFVVPTDGDSLTLEELLTVLEDRDVAIWKYPERLEVLSELPKSEGGKIKKNELTDHVTEQLEAEGKLEPD